MPGRVPELVPRGRAGFQRFLRLQFGLLLALVLGAAALEIAFRIGDAIAGRGASFYLPKAHSAEAFFQPHPFIGVVLRPGAVREGPYAWHVNELGMRGPPMSARKAPGTFRILCLGGSTTFGTGCMEDGNTWPLQLGARLNELASPGVRYEVGNCGVPGFTSVEDLINLELRLLEYQPNAIVLYQAANDARPVQARGFQPDYTNIRRTWTQTPYSPLELFLLGHVRTYARFARGTDPEAQEGALNSKLFVPGFKELHVPSSQGVNEDGVRVYLRNLGNTIAVARRAGIQPVLSTFAFARQKQKPGDEEFFETVESMNRGVIELAGKEGVPLLRIAESLTDRPELYDDWMHMNDQGSIAHGRLAAEQAREQGLFGLSKP